MTRTLTHRQDPPDLSPTESAAVEWWYLQGQLQGATIGSKHVMAAFFRLRDTEGDGPPGAMLLQHVVDAATGAAWHDSRITARITTDHARIVRQVITGTMPAILRPMSGWLERAYFQFTPPGRGVTIDAQGPEVGAAPFSVGWAGFGLGENGSGLLARLSLGNGLSAELTLAPQGAWLDERGPNLHPGYRNSDFAYQCCPRLEARGSVAGEPVEGRIWIDHQWGSYDGWLLDPTAYGYRVLGWDWFGLGLDDGRDLLLNFHRDAASNRLLRSFGVCFEDGVPHRLPTAIATPRRHWTSVLTGARYPVEWQLTLPELGIDGQVVPLRDDQEIPLYGAGAVWEGAARFEGTQAGRRITGGGRLELSGYGAPLTPIDDLRRRARRFALGSAAFAFGARQP